MLNIYLYTNENQLQAVFISDSEEYSSTLLPTTEGEWQQASNLADVNGAVYTYAELSEYLLNVECYADKITNLVAQVPASLLQLHQGWLPDQESADAPEA